MTTTTTVQGPLQCAPQNQAPIGPPSGNSLPTPCTDEARAKAAKQCRISALSKTFGHIPGIPVFTQWNKRIECSGAAVHRSAMAGICGNKYDGAFSVVLSKSYQDNEDGGDVIIYTGSGGRVRWTNTLPQKRIHLGPQTMDQSWDDSPNKALIVSFLTGNPVRVVRSSACGSRYSPLSGYRYDGLYKVAAYWTALGKNGKNICRCRLERLPGQPPIPLRPVAVSARKKRQGLVPGFTSSSSASINTHDYSRQTGVDTRPNQHNTTSAEVGRVNGGFSNQRQQDMCDFSAEADSNMGELETAPQPPPPVSPGKPGTLSRYRWDPKRNELVRVTASGATQNIAATAEESEAESRAADDAMTLVQSEDDGQANECMETEYFSDDGGTEAA